MPKFRLLYEYLQHRGIAQPTATFTPEPADPALLQQVHSPDYVEAYLTGSLDPRAQRRIGLPWSPGLVARTCTAVGGTVLTAQLALQYGIACNTAGGTHHAFPDYGSGFCIFNDLAIAARTLLNAGTVQKILILDLDVHQGDGTAWIFRDEPRVFTFSMHCEANFPGKKQVSDRDVPLPMGLGDQGYLQILTAELPPLLDRVRPDLVLYDAGVDVHGGDRLGKLALTDSGIYRRDRLVIHHCRQGGYPIATVIGGGYAPDIHALVARHALLHRAAHSEFNAKAD